MIRLRPYDDLAAMAVINRLDPHDQIEAETVRGAPVTALALFADWRAMQAVRLASWVIHTATGQPFALLGLSHTGQAGVAAAALVARDHRQYRRELAAAARMIRADMPMFAAERGIHRIEARAWVDHPRASVFLALVGFRNETPADMPGFGRDGSAWFRQFAWIAPDLPSPAIPDPSQRS